jgi:hypothetical protein
MNGVLYQYPSHICKVDTTTPEPDHVITTRHADNILHIPPMYNITPINLANEMKNPILNPTSVYNLFATFVTGIEK